MNVNKPGFEESNIFLSGHVACPGCSIALALRHILNTLGPNSIGVIPPSCMGPMMGAQPYSAMRIPIYKAPLSSSAASATGIRRALKARGRDDITVFAVAGDGGTYDIGFQSLSSVAENNEDIIYICMDNEGYMNTGTQKSSSTPLYANTNSTPGGKKTRKKNLAEIMAAHQVPYLATANVGYLEDLVCKLNKARVIRGTRMIIIHSPCIDGWGIAEDEAVTIARLAVQTGVFPLYEVEGGMKYTINHGSEDLHVKAYLSRQKRYRHLSPEEVERIEEEVRQGWSRLKLMAECFSRHCD